MEEQSKVMVRMCSMKGRNGEALDGHTNSADMSNAYIQERACHATWDTIFWLADRQTKAR